MSEPPATRAAAESFEASAPEYDDVLARNREGARRLVAALPDRDYDEVLDVGCGTGFASEAMLARFRVRRLVALDPSPAMLARLREKLAGMRGVDVRLHEAGVHDMPVAPASFDAVISTMAFHWFPEKPRSMAAMAAALRPGGTLGLLTAGRGSDRELQEIMRGLDPPVPAEWSQVFDLIHRDEREIEDLVVAAGLEPVDVWSERRRRRVPAERFLARIAASSAHVSADLDPEAVARDWERLSEAVRAAEGPDGFETTFVKTFAVARRPPG